MLLCSKTMSLNGSEVIMYNKTDNKWENLEEQLFRNVFLEDEVSSLTEVRVRVRVIIYLL